MPRKGAMKRFTPFIITIFSNTSLGFIYAKSFIISHECSCLFAQYPLLHDINVLIILRNTLTYMHDIKIL